MNLRRWMFSIKLQLQLHLMRMTKLRKLLLTLAPQLIITTQIYNKPLQNLKMPFKRLMNKTPASAIPVMHPANFQPIYEPTFAAGIPLNNYSTLGCADMYTESPRGKDKMKRARRTCNIFCGLAFCHGAKSGRSKGGRTRRCQFLPISLLNDLYEHGDRVCGNDDDDNDPISRERERRIRKVATFLQDLSYHSKVSYCDSDYWKNDFR